MQTLIQDLRYGLRMLWKRPSFTLTVILTLALGIGVNTGIFSIINSGFRPLPVKDPDSIVRLDYRAETNMNNFSYPNYLFFRDQSQVFSGVIAYSEDWLPLDKQEASEETQPVRVEFVSDNFFSVLGASPILGRYFTAEENSVPGKQSVVVLNHRFWQKYLAGDPDIVGKPLKLSGNTFTVIGVMETDFVGLGLDMRRPDLWLPLMMRDAAIGVYSGVGSDKGWFANRDKNWLTVYGRLKPGRTILEAGAETEFLMKQLISADLDINPKDRALVKPAASGRGFGGQMVLMMGATLLVLLIACSNIANLMLARAAGRASEIGVRLCLGASRGRLIRQLLTESLLLAALGGLAGFLLAWWSVELIGKVLLSGRGISDLDALSVSLNPDLRVLGFSLLLSIISAFFFGLAPALRVTSVNLVATIKDEGAAFGQRITRSWLRSGLVVAQVALCIVLLISAGLLLRGFSRALSIDPGFETTNVLVLDASVALNGYDSARSRQFYQELMSRLASMPGVQGVSAGDSPLAGNVAGAVTLQGEGGVSGRQFDRVQYSLVTPGYFETVGIPMIRGRGMTADEMRSGAEVVVVSQSAARNLWPGQDPLGKILLLEPNKKAQGLGVVTLPSARVIGVACDRLTNRLDGSPPIFLYAPLSPQLWTYSSILARTVGDAKRLKTAARAAVKALDPALRAEADTLEEVLLGSRRIGETRSALTLVSALGLLALLLAALGIYGVMAFSVSQRNREIGVRMALGADRRDVMRLFLGQGIRLVGVGALIGVAGGAAVSRLLSSLLFGLSPFDTVAYVSVSALLAAVAMLATYLPARRAATVDPMVALRHE